MLGDVFSLARIIEAHFKDTNNQAVDNNGGDKKDPNINDKQEVKKADDQEIENVKDEERNNVKDQQVSERTINETADTITSLQSKVASFDAKGETLETTSKDLEKKMLDLYPTLHDPQKVAVDQKKKHYKTKYALKIDDEEVKKAKSQATTKIRKLAKEEYGISESKEFSRHHLEDKVVIKEWGMIHPWHFEEFNHLNAREVKIKKQQSSDQGELQKDNATECRVFLMMHMEIYNREIAKNEV
ncbi:hypothetical protein Tco_0493645 [Tanacetum coccineum]